MVPLNANCALLFQIALLLTADPETAEATVANAFENIDLSVPPSRAQLATLEKNVAIESVRTAGTPSSATVAIASSMLQSGLRPVLQLERFPRACFVLHFLLGYGTSSCAQMQSIDESGVKALLRIGLIQLHRAVLLEN